MDDSKYHPKWPDKPTKKEGGGMPPRSYFRPAPKREALDLPCGKCDACLERFPDLCQSKS